MSDEAADTTMEEGNSRIADSVLSQIRELGTSPHKEYVLERIVAELEAAKSAMGSAAGDAIKTALTSLIEWLGEVQAGEVDWACGDFLADQLDALKNLISRSYSDDAPLHLAVQNALDLATILSNSRPNIDAVLGDLEEIKKLRGGPADATAFHDFHVLQLAFDDIWAEAFDGNLRRQALELYHLLTELYDEAGVEMPPISAINDVEQLENFIREVEGLTGTLSDGAPTNVLSVFPEAGKIWALLGSMQQAAIMDYATRFAAADNESTLKAIRRAVNEILENPQGLASRIEKTILELGNALVEPYAFDVFAPDSYNFGLLLTYRQRWEPGEYQAGNLAATIPLAPNETRKYSKKTIVKSSRASKEIEKSMSSFSRQTAETGRAEAEIMQMTSATSNFKMTSRGSFNIAIGSIDATNEFALDQTTQSRTSKKDFHEATLKAAEEYKLERSLEIDATSSAETEEASSGEISNPNNEITVTYLFYELQRRFTVYETLYRARPVILVAQEVPAPHEIGEAWLLQYQWIISRVLLDDSFRPALDYLSSGMAGDEVSLEVIKAQWLYQKNLLVALESQVLNQLKTRDEFREALVDLSLEERAAEAAEMTTAQKIFTLGLVPDINETRADLIKARREASETRLKYTEEALADAQGKLKQAADSYGKATREYADALKAQYERRMSADKLRMHVKQNILYYMQAIWDHEPPDQRFFRLYDKTIKCPGWNDNLSEVEAWFGATLRDPVDSYLEALAKNELVGGLVNQLKPELPLNIDRVQLHTIADLDNPIGYKGNYIVFPLKKPLYITTFMLQGFIDDFLGLRDPHENGNFDIREFDARWEAAASDAAEREGLRKELIRYLTVAERDSDEIIVPTGQLFIEALPGSHPLLEDFKLLHRLEDLRKAKAEVRRAELENIRLAARLVNGEREDPCIEKKIVVEGAASVEVGDDT